MPFNTPISILVDNSGSFMAVASGSLIEDGTTAFLTAGKDSSNNSQFIGAVEDISGSIRLQVEADIKPGATIEISGGLTGATGKIVWDQWNKNQSINSSTFTTIYSSTIAGVFFSSVFQINTNKMFIRIKSDGNTCLDLDLEELSKDFKLKSSGGSGDFLIKAISFSEYKGNRWVFDPPEVIKYNSLFEIQLKSKNGNKKLVRGISIRKEAS